MNGRKGLCLSNTFSQSRDVLLATFQECLPLFGLSEENDDYRINRTDMDIYIGENVLHLRSCEQAEKLRGINCADLYIDEARNMATNKVFLIAIGRMRQREDGQCFISTSPRGKDWVYRLSEDDKKVTLITQRTRENPFLPKSYIEDLETRYGGAYAKQELDAEIIEMNSGIIDISKFALGNYLPNRPILSLDIAVSTKTSADFSAICIASKDSIGRMVIHEVWRDHVEYRQLKNKIIEMAVKYNVSSINVEDVAAQRIVIDDIKHEPKIARYPIKGHRPRGDKLARALPWVSRLELNMLALQAGKWNEVFLEECTTFDGKNGEHDDMIDSVSMAYDVLYNNSVAMGQKVKY